MEPQRRGRPRGTALARAPVAAVAAAAMTLAAMACTRPPPAGLLLPRPSPRADSPGPDEVWVRWLGTAGFEIRTERTTLLIDPFLSRPSLWDAQFGRLLPDERAIAAHIGRADYVLVSHTHYDHAMDVGPIALRTGARVVGSGSALNLARSHGIPDDRLIEVGGESVVVLGDFRVRAVPSEHGKVILGMAPLEGAIANPPALPARMTDYGMGRVFGYLLETGDRSIYHHGSAGVVDAGMKTVRAETVLLCVAGSSGTVRYVERVLGAIGPRLLVPCHFDDFFHPFEDGMRILGSADLEGVLDEAKRLVPGLQTVVLDFFQEIHLPRRGPFPRAGRAGGEIQVLDRGAGLLYEAPGAFGPGGWAATG